MERVEVKFVRQTPVVAPCESGGEIDEPGMVGQVGTPEFAVDPRHSRAQRVVPDGQSQEFGARRRNDRSQQDLGAGCGSLFSQPQEGVSGLTDDGATGDVNRECRRDEIVPAALNHDHTRLQGDGVALKAMRHLS